MPKYHKVVVTTNPISAREVEERINARDDVRVTEVLEDTFDRRLKSMFLDTKDDLPKDFRYLLDLLDELQLKPYIIGPINLEREGPKAT